MGSTSYTTVQGDTWDRIAKRLYGDERRMDKLIQANPDRRATLVFSAGIVLSVPAVDTTQTAELPPWKTAK